MDQAYPSNSHKSKPAAEEDTTRPPRVEQVVESDVIRKKPGVGKQFKNMFFSGNARNAVQQAFLGVLVPSAKETFAEFAKDYIDRQVFGDTRRRTGRGPVAGPKGYFNYSQASVAGRMAATAGETMRAVTNQVQSDFDLDDIILESRPEAERVIDSLYDTLQRYETVSVADFYKMLGLKTTHTDFKWGWDDLRGSGVTRTRKGWLIDLPDPEPID